MAERLLLHAAPFLRRSVSTPGLMVDVAIAAAPTLVIAGWLFGVGAILVVLAATLGCLLAEALWGPQRRAGLLDGSAALTGMLLGLTMPPGLPLWMAFLGGVVAIVLGKAVFGGLGNNLFNPALVGRAFLQAAFPTWMTTWRAHGGGFWDLPASSLALPLMQGAPDTMTAATPLAQMKFEHVSQAASSLLFGVTSGSTGETCALAILVGGVYLAARRTFDWRIPVSMVGAVALLSALFYAIDPGRYPTPQFMVLSGGLLFGAVFMATDPVGSPTSPRGAWIFGAGAGALVVLIRLFGGLPEGVMYAILLMNSAAPLIERSTQPKPFGRREGAA